MEMRRNNRIDVLKGIAILAIVLYHFGGGYLTYGYLGVDIFFVISGYLMMKSIVKAMRENRFYYWRFIVGRIARLWPLVLIMTTVALCLGLFTMLPDDLENLSESVIASNVFANNVLSCITTRNYWNIANVFKPLMHTWYAGVLMQAYVFLPLVYLVVFKLTKGNINAVKTSVVVITLMSLIAYLLPGVNTAEKFYYLPFRAFEINTGSIIVFIPKYEKMTARMQYVAEAICFCIIFFLLCSNIAIPLSSLKLLLIVCATAVLVYIFVNTAEKSSILIKAFSCVGRASFSIYLCHQIIVAYMYYAITDRTDIHILLLFVLVVSALSAGVYLLIEKPLGFVAKKNVRHIILACIVVCLITSCVSGTIYLHAGVVRDVPELGIETANVHRGMHAEYCDVPYSWDVDFVDDEKTHVWVIGNSFGRDFANILNESSYSQELEISYTRESEQQVLERKSRIGDSDYIFYAVKDITGVPDWLKNIVPEEKLYVVGDKKFGNSNGIIYSHRFSDDYFEQRVKLDDDFIETNVRLQKEYKDHFVDMISLLMNENNEIQVFTDDNHYISQDCYHLTKYGAQFYSRILPLNELLR